MVRKAAPNAVSWSMSFAVGAVAVEFCISANFLTWVGVSYVSDGGFLFEKIHPGTYLICVAFALKIFEQCQPHAKFYCIFGGDSKLALYFWSASCCILYVLLTTGSRNTVVLLDTFLPAGMLAGVVRTASAREREILLTVFRVGVCMNCLVALGEGVAHATLVPLYLNDVGYHPASGEFRPTGFYDHPLTGATMTLMGLALAPHGRWYRLSYIVLAAVALIAFGGRIAIAAALASAMSLKGARVIDCILCRKSATMHLLLYYGFLLLAGAGIAMSAFEAGFGQRLLGHLYWDSSAQTRVAQWSILGKLDDWQLLFGSRREDLLALLTPLWLQSGVEVVENFWLLMFVSLGAAGF